MKKLTGLESVRGVHAVAEMDVPDEADLLSLGEAPLRRLLVLEQLQDPGNMVKTNACWFKHCCLGAIVDGFAMPCCVCQRERGLRFV